MSVSTTFDERVIERVIDQLARGNSLSAICKGKGMPDRRTVQRWLQADDALADRLLEARETGFHDFAEETLKLVEEETDPHRARVILAARQWYLGKLSNAFRDRPASVGAVINVDVGDTFDAIARILDQAAGRISSRRDRTYLVDGDGTARPTDAARRLAHLDGDGGQGVGEDEDRR